MDPVKELGEIATWMYRKGWDERNGGNISLRLRDEDCKVIDVAFDLGFGSVDGYQRAFLREFGCNPREYAAHPVPLYLMTPYGVKYRFTEKEPMNMEQIKNVFICLLYTSPSPRDRQKSRMPSSA